MIKQKKKTKEDWEDTHAIDFRRLQTGDGVELQLSTHAPAHLAEQYEILKSHLAEFGVRSGTHNHVSGESDQVIVVGSAAVASSIQSLLDIESGEAFWSELATNHPALLKRLADGAVHEDRPQQLTHFREFLMDSTRLKYSAATEGIDATKDEKIWQYFSNRTHGSLATGSTIGT